MIVSPGSAGLASVISLKSAWVRTPGPIPVSSTEKMPGLLASTGTTTPFDNSPLLFTTIVAGVPEVEKGVCRLICPAETKNSGASTPLMVTLIPARLVGSGVVLAVASEGASPEPNSESSVPPEMG